MFGRRLKEERLKRKLTQKQFGVMVGVSATMIMYYESGAKRPSVEQLMRMADFLGIDINYLLGMEYLAKERTTEYTFRLAKEEAKILRELRKKKKLYDMLVDDPKRTVELIDRKMT